MHKKSFLLGAFVSLYFISCTFFNQVGLSSLKVVLPETSTRGQGAENVSYYEVTASCPSLHYNEMCSTKGKYTSTVEFENLSDGTYTISAKAFDSESTLIAEGKNTAKVTSGSTVNVTIVLGKVLGRLNFPYAVWSQRRSGGSYFYYTDLAIRENVQGIDVIKPIGECIDFTFDNNRNFYSVIHDGVNQNYKVLRYEYNPVLHNYSSGVQVFSSSTNIYLYTDVDRNVIYMRDQGSGTLSIGEYDANTGRMKTTYTGNSANFDKFAVKNQNVYVPSNGEIMLYDKLYAEGTTLTETITINGMPYNVGHTFTESKISTLGGGGPKITLLGAGSVLGIENSSNTEITDIQVVGNYLYAIIANVNSGYYSRGCAVKLLIKEDGTLEYKSNFGWYEENGLKYDPYSESNRETPESFKAKYFAGPVKFIAIKPKELVIADDGGYYYKTGPDAVTGSRAGNINRVVTIDLENFIGIKSSTDIENAEFNTVTYYEDDNGSSFEALLVKQTSN